MDSNGTNEKTSIREHLRMHKHWIIPTRVDPRNDTCARLASWLVPIEPLFVWLLVAWPPTTSHTISHATTMINNPVNARRHPQPFDVASETCHEIVTQPLLLCFVSQKFLIQVLQRVLRNLHPDHLLPIIPLTESQSTRHASPSRTLARR